MVLRVAFHPHTVPPHYSATGNIVRPTLLLLILLLLLPGTVGPSKCLHVLCTTRLCLGWFGDEHQLRHEDYLAPRARYCVGLHVHLRGDTHHR